MTTNYFVAYDSDIDSDYYAFGDKVAALALAAEWAVADWYTGLAAEAEYCSITVYELTTENDPWEIDGDWNLWAHLDDEAVKVVTG